MSDPLFNGRTYAENLAYLNASSVGDITAGPNNLGWAGFLQASLNNEAVAAGKTLEGFFAKLNKNATNAAQNPNAITLPQTWEEFIRAFRRDYLGQNPPLPPETTANGTFFAGAVGFGLLSGQAEGTLTSSLSQILTDEGISIDAGAQFKKAFAEFLQHYPYKNDGSVGTSTEFIQNYNNFLGITATLLDGGTSINPNSAPITDSITSYEELFKAFPSPTRTEFTTSGTPVAVTPTFEDRFREFYKAYVAEHGYFATGRAFDEWSKQIQKEYFQGLDTSFPLRPPGYTGVSRSVVSRAQGTKTFPLFANDPTMDAKINTLILGQGSGNFTVQFSITPTPLFNINTDKLTFIPKDVLNFTLLADGTGTFTIDTNSDQYDAFETVESRSLALKSVLQNFSLVTSNPLPGERTIQFTVSATSGTVLTAEAFTDQATITGISTINTSVTTDSSARVMIINRLFKLIAEMIDVMQKVAASQAQYLTFLTQWQKAFTDLISEIKVFTRGDGTIFGQVDSTTATVQTFSDQRNQANQQNLNTREKLSNLRGVAADSAKRMQSRINQSQDAATQQGQFASSLIQQLSTLLGAIYR